MGKGYKELKHKRKPKKIKKNEGKPENLGKSEEKSKG